MVATRPPGQVMDGVKGFKGLLVNPVYRTELFYATVLVPFDSDARTPSSMVVLSSIVVVAPH
jgi:hypothetical protein